MPSDDSSSSQHLDSNPMRDTTPEPPRLASSELLTHRHHEMINIYFFKSLILGGNLLHNARELHVEVNKIMTIKCSLFILGIILIPSENTNFRALHFYFILFKSLGRSPWFLLGLRRNRISAALPVIN